MTVRVPLWVALAACVGCVALGSVRAQQPAEKREQKEPEVLTEYPYLPARYGEVYMPSLAEWQALRLTALGASTTRITDNFSRQQFTCFVTPRGFAMTLDLLPEPTWKLYAGGGKFTASPEVVKPELQKAIDAVMRSARNFFPEMQDKDVTLRLFVKSEMVGVWQGGKLTLSSEQPAKN